jgi:hypothetical protein
MEVQLHSYLNQLLSDSEWSASRAGTDEPYVFTELEALVGRRTNPDAENNLFASAGNRTPITRSSSLFSNRNSDLTWKLCFICIRVYRK